MLYKNNTYQISTTNQETRCPISYKDIEVIYEDAICLVVSKPTDLLIHDDGDTKDTLCARVNFYTQCNNEPFQAYPIHRIDKDTSGLVLFIKHPFFHSFFDWQIKEHIIQKQYLAVVQGNFPYPYLHIENAIARDRHNAKKMIIHKKGKIAISDIQKISYKQDFSLLKIHIKTGRKHQIRVHLSSLGFPIYNDPLYGNISDNRKLLLQSNQISFYHPIDKRNIHIKALVDPRFKPFSQNDLTSTTYKLKNMKHQK